MVDPCLGDADPYKIESKYNPTDKIKNIFSIRFFF